MNNNKIASPAQKQVSPSTEKFQNGLAQVEGIITSPIKLKEPREDQPYYWAFFQLDLNVRQGLNSEIPVIFRLKDPSPCVDCENAQALCQAFHKGKKKCEDCCQPHCEDGPGTRPEIPYRAKALLTGT